MMGIILEIEQVLRRALQRVPLAKWPWLAGWEQLSPHVSLRPDMVAEIPVECMPEQDDRSGDEDSEVEEELEDGDSGAERRAAEPTAVQSRGSEVLQAWDGLQREKVAARTTVGAWTLEFVLRKIGEGAVGDCYAKCAGLPRVRSRVALLAALGMAQRAGVDDHPPKEPEAGQDGSAAAAVPESGRKTPVLEVTEPSGGGDDGKVEGGEAEIRQGRLRRPPEVPLDLWRLTHGGFPDGDTD